jgi:NadR type nicotinamide-nucleotide adenylyltransferase
MLKRIAITGPESTGKSDLAKALAEHYQTVWVQEYARDYLNNLNCPYDYKDILKIAKGQVKAEEKILKYSNRLIFVDTEMIVLKIWCEVKYGKCHPWILDRLTEQNFELYLLTDIDLPWQPDPLREHPNKRRELFNLYLDELKKRNLPFEIINSFGQQRLLNAIMHVEKRLKIDQ